MNQIVEFNFLLIFFKKITKFKRRTISERLFFVQIVSTQAMRKTSTNIDKIYYFYIIDS